MAYRERSGEVLKPSSPLMREQFDCNDAFKVIRPKFMSLITLYVIIDNMLWRSGLRTRTKREDKVRHDVMRYHGLRKFAITQTIKAKVDFSARSYLVGHKVSRGLDVNYDRTTEEDQLYEYMKAMDFLTISPENRLRKQVTEQDHIIQVQMAHMEQENIILKKSIKDTRDEWHALLSEPEKFMEMLQEGRGKSK